MALTKELIEQNVYMDSMGPTMLSRMLAEPNRRIWKEEPDWESIYQHCTASIDSMRQWRYSWWAHDNRLAEYWQPRRNRFLVTPNQMDRGHPINDSIIDGTAVKALRICASGMWSGFTNPDVPWVGLIARDKNFQPDSAGRKWFDDVGEILLDVYDQSNFYAEYAQAFEDLPLFGTAPIITYEDYYDKIRLYTPCAGEYFCKAGARQSRDTLGREFQQTTQQIVDMFGYDNCPMDVRKLWDEGGASRDREFVVNALIEPNFEIKGPKGKMTRPVAGGFVYREIYWIRGVKGTGPLSMRGFHWRPYTVMIWAKTGNDPYGRSPCMDELGDNKQVQWQQLRKGELIEKLVRPPMTAPVSMKMEPSSILPGRTTYVNTQDGKAGFTPAFEVDPQGLPALVEDIKETNTRIERALFVDVFMAITNMQGVQPRNQLELTKRDLERIQQLGPVINLVENSLGEQVSRTLDILQRRNQLPRKPPSLQGVPLKIDFDTMMRKAQRASVAMSMRGTIASLGEMSTIAKQAQVPDPIRKFNLEKAAEKMALDEGWPVDCIFSDAEVQKHDAARMRAVQAAQAPQQALAAVQGAKALGSIPAGPGTMLGQMTGQNPGG